MRTETLILGGGLSGLAVAGALSLAGRDWLLLEARARLGGRILTTGASGVPLDLGPSWIWPGQPHVTALLDRLGLDRFAQHHSGALMHEDESGTVARLPMASPMQGALRVRGGLGALVDALAATLPQDRILTDRSVTALALQPGGMRADTAQGPVEADRAVLAIPPRLASVIPLSPPLPDAARAACRATPTWMAGHAKVAMVYDSAFWRAQGLSGTAFSRHGPLAEIHDASPAEGEAAALFGFIGLPAGHRRDGTELRSATLAQLTRLFGPSAAHPREVILQDWADEPFTAMRDDLGPTQGHPSPGLPPALAQLWDGRLLFANSETADHSPGLIEGALEAAARAASVLTS